MCAQPCGRRERGFKSQIFTPSRQGRAREGRAPGFFSLLKFEVGSLVVNLSLDQNDRRGACRIAGCDPRPVLHPQFQEANWVLAEQGCAGFQVSPKFSLRQQSRLFISIPPETREPHGHRPEAVRRDEGHRFFGSTILLGDVPPLEICDLDLVQKIMVKDFSHFTDRVPEEAVNHLCNPDFLGDRIFKKGLLFLRGE